MRRGLVLCACMLLVPVAVAAAGDVSGDKPRQPGVVSGDEPSQAGAASGDRPPKAGGESEDKGSNAGPVSREGQPDAKELSGMSIVGNDEAPKSLYIVPWKSSEIGAETSLDTMLNEGEVPVDRDVFRRQVEFHKISTGG